MIDRRILNLSIEELKIKFKNKINDLSLLEQAKIINEKYSKYIFEIENLRAKIKKASNTFFIKKEQVLFKQAKLLKKEFSTKNQDFLKIKKELFHNMSFIPNFPDINTPVGYNDEDDVIIKSWGSKITAKFDYITKCKVHELVDWEKTSHLFGTRFVSYIKRGSLLRRAIVNFLLDYHQQNGFLEFHTPVMINAFGMFGTGNFPKFKNDVYEVDNKKYLIPTAEVSLVNFFANKIFNTDLLPISLVQYSECFRRESGAAGKYTKGLIRLHQFGKVELVKLCHPTTSNKELMKIISINEDILKKFNIPYQIKELCTQNLGFSASKTFDIEVWIPSLNKYVEISSCSNCTDFQSRRAGLKFKDKNKKNIYLHTLNGSSLAIDRLFACVLEIWQDENGVVHIPQILHKYLSFRNI